MTEPPPNESTSTSPRRGRRVAWTLGVASVALLIGAGVFCRKSIEEQWLIWQLDSKDENKRRAAAEKLGEMKSLRSVPYLVQLIEVDEREYAGYSVVGFLSEGGGIEHPGRRSGYEFSPVVFSLYGVGPAALPIVERILFEDPSRSSEGGDRGPSWISPRMRGILSIVWCLWRDPGENVKRVERLSFPRGASPPAPVRQGVSGKQRA